MLDFLRAPLPELKRIVHTRAGVRVIIDVASIAIAVGVFLAFLGILQSRRLRARQFEMLYAERFWTLMDKMSLSAIRGSDERVLPENENAVWGTVSARP